MQRIDMRYNTLRRGTCSVNVAAMERTLLSERRNCLPLGLRPVGRGTLQEQILRQIKQRLITGQFRPGQQLPLRRLAAELGTSAMPVRDALQRLASNGVLIGGANRPMQVPDLDADHLNEVREIRGALEGLAAERAARNADRDAVARLDACMARLDLAARAGKPTEFFLANWLFHLELVTAAGSPMMLTMIEPLWLRMGPALRLSKPEPRRMLEVVPVHAEIVAAIRAQDASGARSAVVRDINDCFDMIGAAAATGGRVRAAVPMGPGAAYRT